MLSENQLDDIWTLWVIKVSILRYDQNNMTSQKQWKLGISILPRQNVEELVNNMLAGC